MGGLGAVDIQAGGVVKNRESPDFRSLRVGISDVTLSALDENRILDHLHG